VRYLVLLLLLSCKTSATVTIGVTATADYERPTKAAMRLWNSFVGCDFFVPGKDVQIKSSDGTGVMLPEHAAATFQTPRGWEIHVSYPGDLHDQACIIVHELGHVLGLQDGAPFGAMSYECPDFIRIRDDDVAIVKARHCK